MDHSEILKKTRSWVDNVVVDLNLCPFAHRELNSDRVRFSVSEACDEQSLLADLEAELSILSSDKEVETTLLVHPYVLDDFSDYNQFLGLADELLQQLNLDGVFQLASFHPDYQFAGTSVDDAENYTNRSPYPILHILREESLTKAIAAYGDVDEIPIQNIKKMNSLGVVALREILEAC